MFFETEIWYLVKTKFRMENVAEINLARQSIEFFLPRFTSGKREGKVVFPGYIFVRPKINDTFQSIRSSKGINDFVRFEMAFANATDEMISEIREVIDLMNDRIEQTNLHQKGEEIYIKSGPFKNFSGVFDSYDANQSANVLINFLRHEQLVKIKADMIA